MAEQLAWYDGPELRAPEEMAALLGRYRADSLLTSYAWSLENRAYEDGLETLSAREQLVVSGAVFEREINADGIHSLLDDHRAYLDTAKLCMLAVGHPELADLIEDANAVFVADPDDSEGTHKYDNAYYAMGIALDEALIRLATSGAKERT